MDRYPTMVTAAVTLKMTYLDSAIGETPELALQQIKAEARSFAENLDAQGVSIAAVIVNQTPIEEDEGV